MTTTLQIKPWQRLWVKLAILGTLGVVITHSIHLVVMNRSTSLVLKKQLVADGRSLAHLVALQSADALLTEDRVKVQELVDTASASANVAYCFIHKGQSVLASSFKKGTPTALLNMNHGKTPLIVKNEDDRYLDLAQPVLDGSIGSVRIGLRLDMLTSARQRLALILGSIALGVAALGALAAFVLGHRMARPVGQMVTVLQHLDPAAKPVPIPDQRNDEIGILARKVNDMRVRLHKVYLEQEQARRRQMQTEKLAALGTLVAGVAHEINNPLAGMKNCQRRLLRQDLSESQRQEYFGLMREGLARIELVVLQLLHFARIRPPRRSHESLEHLCSAATKLLRPMLITRHLVLKQDLSEAGIARVNADSDQVSQALTNLLINAIHVTPDGGTVWLSTRIRDSLVGVEIRDEGPGIPTEIRNQIENPFFTTKPEGEGTGLGLSVTRTIAEAHEGDLTFEFPEKGGTVATLWIPRSEERRDSDDAESTEEDHRCI